MTARSRIAVLCALLLAALCACGQAREDDAYVLPAITGHMDLSYAEQFSVDYLEGGGALLTVGNDDRYLILPAGERAPSHLDPSVTLLRRPIRNLYLASSSAADLFLQLNALDAVRLTGTTRANWRLPEMRQALDEGRVLYAGKYGAPDFELLLSEDCGLAVENTMLYHSPETKEQLETLGIPVLVERSSYEPHPLGRVEWIKVYGLLTGHEAEAERFFARQVRQLSALEDYDATGKTVAFFHINTNGAAVVRKPGDYVSKMIALAGGTYVFSDLPGEENALSTMNMQMEAFYAGAKEAEILIYNSTIDGPLSTLDELLEKAPLLADSRAVQEGNVWCTEQSMFQKTSAAAGMISDLHAVLSGGADGKTRLTFLHRLT